MSSTCSLLCAGFFRLLTLQPSGWRHCVPLKSWLTFSGLHNFSYQKIKLFLTTSFPLRCWACISLEFWRLNQEEKISCSWFKCWLISLIHFDSFEIITFTLHSSMQNAWSIRIVMVVKLTWLNLSTKFVFLPLSACDGEGYDHRIELFQILCVTRMFHWKRI
jgi:hypothetical protein